MPDKRAHRGPHPDDARLFSPAAWPALRAAAGDLAWLLDRGYAETSALKLVGDRHGLEARQRTAVARCVCSSDAREGRALREVRAADLAGRALDIDGYNVLTTVEAALGGGVILLARDGCYRDMASMHGTYRKVQETLPAIDLIGRQLAAWGFGRCTWYLDRPVSNSGRLQGVLLDAAAKAGWPWQVELVWDPDRILAESASVVASADSRVLDQCGAWTNLARRIVEAHVPTANVLDLSIV